MTHPGQNNLTRRDPLPRDTETVFQNARANAKAREAMINAGYMPTSGGTADVVPLQVPAHDSGDRVAMGETLDTLAPVTLDLGELLNGRLLIQGASGAGKSWTLRRLIEQTKGHIQQIVVDPEGEFASLAEHCGMLDLAGHELDPGALHVAAGRVREHGIPVRLDLSEIPRVEQMKAATAFFTALIEAPREHWHPVMVAVDEAHIFAPIAGTTPAPPAVRTASAAAITDLMGRGRKRGIASVLATQRLARISRSAVSEAHNFLIGMSTLDLDIRRAAETIGWDAARAFDRLPELRPGDFVTSGPAFSRSPAVIRVGPVETEHVGAAPEIHAPAEISLKDAASLMDLDALMADSAADMCVHESNAQTPALREIRKFVRDPSFATAGAIWEALLPLRPDGAMIDDLSDHIGRAPGDVVGGLTLLDRFGMLEFMGEGADRSVRIAGPAIPKRTATS